MECTDEKKRHEARLDMEVANTLWAQHSWPHKFLGSDAMAFADRRVARPTSSSHYDSAIVGVF